MHNKKAGDRYNRKKETPLLLLLALAAIGSFFVPDMLRLVYALAAILFLFRSFQDAKRKDDKRMYQNVLIVFIIFVGVFLADTN